MFGPITELLPSELELLAAAAGLTVDELRAYLRAEVERARAAWLRAAAGLH